jgi:diguanylate cyclase (GGDEF)-like protein/PAS domain S-box-containing protein
MFRRVGPAYGLWTLLLVVLYLFVPSTKSVAWLLVVTTAFVSIAVGVRRNRPRRRLPWALLGISYLAFVVGTITAVVLQEMGRTAFPSVADGIFLGLSAPLLMVALYTLTRSGAMIRDRASVIDALILTAGAGFLSWTFLISPNLLDPTLSVLEKLISIAYPLGDLLILSILVRLAIGARRSWSVVLLLVSGFGLLTADVLYSFSQLDGGWTLGGPIDVGWAVFYIAGGAAALHPSMTRLTEPQVDLRPAVLKTRRVVLGVASLVAPAVLLIQSLNGGVKDGVIISVGSAVLVLLAIARMSVVASGLRRTMTRERELRRACEALLSATDTAQVRQVVHAAVTALLPPGTDHRAVLLTRETDLGEPEQAHGTLNMLYTATLPPSVTAELGDFELTLHCPLSIGGSELGDLFVAAGEQALVNLQESVAVLAGQAASILDHIALNREINKRDSEAYFRTLVLNATDVILIIDASGHITYASPSARSILRTGTLGGTNLLDLVDPGHRDDAAANIRAVRRNGRPVDTGWPVLRADGEPAEMEISIRDLRHEPTVAGLVLTLRDITDRRRLERELRDRAFIDPLTGLGNRLQFQDTVQRVIESSAACVLLVNVDDFRVVNDTMGHAVGDELLVAIGNRLTVVAGERGRVARLGADEFGIVVTTENLAFATADVEDLATEVLDAFAEPFLVAGSMLTVQPSIGVAASSVDAPAAVLTQADVALSAAKGEGKARWRRYEESLHAQVLQRMQLRTELNQAIADGAFVLYYQPIVDLPTGQPRGLEALVRWQHPVRGMVPPLEFIQVAEESGLIVPLGEWVLKTAVAAAAEWQRDYPNDPPYVSVNVSVRQFRAPNFVDLVLGEVARAGLRPDRLTVEITESLLLGDQEQINLDIARLRVAGIKVSIDDFGTGYSSLSYLHRVPVDTLKLDKSFVDTISTSSQQLDLVRGIIQLAHTLHLDVVAEGIETAEDQAHLIGAGCGYGQGFYFARPMPEDEVPQWLAANTMAASLRT